MNYTFDEHRYNFAVWTAARAAQRGVKGFSIEYINSLFLELEIQSELSNAKFKSYKEFDLVHSVICNKLIEQSIKDISINSKLRLSEKLTYGRAAKLIAIFIKTNFVLGENGKGNFSKFAHPPIDRIMLTNAKKDRKIDSIPNWSKLDEEQYFNVLDKLRVYENEGLWSLERYWKLT